MPEIRLKARKTIGRWLEEAGELTPEETAVAAAELIAFVGVGRPIVAAFLDALATDHGDTAAQESLDSLRSVAQEKWHGKRTSS